MIAVKRTLVDYHQAGFYSNLVQDYLDGNDFLSAFIQCPPKAEAVTGLFDRAQLNADQRMLLSATIKRQYEEAGISTAGLPIEALKDEGTFTVCTGHQLCILGGPLFMLYKLLTTINLAEELQKQYPYKKIVPVFWMATEDHDFKEVAQVTVYSKQLEWQPGQEPAFGENAVGRLPLREINVLIEEVQQLLGSAPFAGQVIEKLQTAYIGQNNLADATRLLFHHLLGQYGLLIINPDDRDLKASFAAIMLKDAMLGQNEKAVTEVAAQLKMQGYPVQVNPRRVNLFYIGDDKRTRIASPDEQEKGGKTWDETLRTEMEQFPDRFSPNVILRPMYQQSILPNLVYVGGPGEINYWLELKHAFEQNNIFFPMLLPRNSVVWVDKRSAETWTALGFQATDLFSTMPQLQKAYALRSTSSAVETARQVTAIAAIYSELAENWSAIDKTLFAAVKAEEARALQGLKTLESKAIKAVKSKVEVQANQMQKVKTRLFPGEIPQERHDSMIALWSQHGTDFITTIKEIISPFDFSVKVVEEQ